MNLERRDVRDSELLGAVAEALSLLLEPGELDAGMNRALRLIGEGADADRVYVFENSVGPEGPHAVVMSQRYEWVRQGVSVQIANPELQNLSYARLSSLLEEFLAGRAYQRLARNFTPEEKALFAPQQIFSLACMPIVCRGELWGFVGVDNCREEREWTDGQLLALKAAAAGLGGAIVRRDAERSLETQTQELKRQRGVALSLMEDARRSAKEAALANQAKSTFLAMMSHEIRTPLNGVIGSADLLLESGLSDAQLENVRTIRSCGDALLGLISDILDISKIESGRLDLEPVHGSVRDCVNAVIQALDVPARRNEVRISLQIEDSIPRILNLDFNRLRQIFFNLIGNAIKFSRRRAVKIRLRGEACPETPDQVRLFGEVRDTGCGIAPDDLRTIFEPFKQGQGALRTAAGGTGLGLAICRRVVEAMGGEIKAESTVGEGSAFSFYVLAGQVDAFLPVREDEALSEGSLRQTARILIVDDVKTNLLVAQRLLERLGFQAETASSGREAAAMAQKISYDVIFMDILMPEIDGYETVRRIRAQDFLAERPRPWIVALTADALVESRRRCLEAGMDDFLSKPVGLGNLRNCLLRWSAEVSREASQGG